MDGASKGLNMSLLEGKVGLVVGIANDRSYAWHIAKALSENGAQCAYAHIPGEKNARRTERAVSKIHDNPWLFPCDAGSDESLDELFAAYEKDHGRMDFLVHSIAFADREWLKIGNFSNTPRKAYLDAIEAETPQEQETHLKRHAQHVRTHVKQLSGKTYQSAFAETPDFVVMLIPGETFVSAAVETDAGLIEYAFEHKVLIATPTTLMALVKSIAYGWQQEKMAENAIEVQKTAKDLYDRLNTFSRNLASVGKSLSASVNHYNKAVGSLESRVLPSARRFEAMGVVSQSDELEDPGAVEVEPRQMTLIGDDG